MPYPANDHPRYCSNKSGYEGRDSIRLLVDGHPADPSTYVRVLKDALNIRVMRDIFSVRVLKDIFYKIP